MLDWKIRTGAKQKTTRTNNYGDFEFEGLPKDEDLGGGSLIMFRTTQLIGKNGGKLSSKLISSADKIYASII